MEKTGPACALALATSSGMVPCPARMRIHLTTLALLFAGNLAFGHDEVTPKPKLLQNGIPQRKLSAKHGDGHVFMLTVPPGARELVVATRDGTGDADLYVRRNVHPTIFNFDEMSRRPGNRESIRIESPEPGPWYILVDAFDFDDEFKGVKLTATYRMARGSLPVPKFIPGPGVYSGNALVRLGGKTKGTTLRYTLDDSEPTIDSPAYTHPFPLTNDTQVRVKPFRKDGTAGPEAAGWFFVVPEEEVTTLANANALHHRAGTKDGSHVFKVTVPPGQPRLQVRAEGGTGEIDLFLQREEIPSRESFTFRGRRTGKSLNIDVTNPEPGEWFIRLQGRTAFAGYSILAVSRPPQPDLIVWEPVIDPYLSTEVFQEGMCEVEEGLITPGVHRLLRFTTESRNVGGTDMLVPTPEQRPDLFEFQECHGHFHFLGFASYRLLNGMGEEVAAGRKVSFCLLDTVRWDSASNPHPVYNCSVQGIQAGWSDVYDAGLPGQWIDITGLAAGTYTLEITMNPEQAIEEANYTNNTTSIQVEITED
jgi:hypothetical protein